GWGGFFAGKGQFAGYQPVKQTTETEQVTTIVNRPALHLLRGHVRWSAHERAFLGQVRAGGGRARPYRFVDILRRRVTGSPDQPEIEDFHAAATAFQPDVARL